MALPPYNPDYVPVGPNEPRHEYYKGINHVELARADSNRSEFFGTVGGVSPRALTVGNADGNYGFRKGYYGAIDPNSYTADTGTVYEITNFSTGGGGDLFVVTFDGSPDPWAGGVQVATSTIIITEIQVTVNGITGTVSWVESNGRYEGVIAGVHDNLSSVDGENVPYHMTYSNVETRFVMVIETDTPDQQFTLPLHSGTTNVTIDMGAGDGPQAAGTYDHPAFTATYATPGTYTIYASGSWEGLKFGGQPDAVLVREVKNLGMMGWQTMLSAFTGCVNMHTLTPGQCDTGAVSNWYSWCSTTGLTHGNTTGLDMTSAATISAGYGTTPNMVTFDPTGLNAPGVSIARYDEIFFRSALPADQVKLADINVQGLTTYTGSGYLFGGMFNVVDDPDEVGIDQAIYDHMLLNYAAQNPPPSPLGAGGLITDYTRGGSVEAARNTLVGLGWVINDAGRLPPVRMDAPELRVEGPNEITVILGPEPFAYNYPVENYDLQWREANGTWAEVQNVTSPHSLTGLDPNTAYEVQTVGNSWVSDQDGRGEWSLSGNATTAGVVTIPGQMAPPSLVVDSDTEITVTLAVDPANGGAPIDRRDVRWSTDEATWTELLDITSPVQLDNLPPATLIYTQSRCANSVDADPDNWSVSATATTDAIIVPAVLTNPTGTHSGTNGATNLSATTNQNLGTMTVGIYLQGSTPTGAEIASGTGAGFAVNTALPVGFAGVVAFTDLTGLSSNTDYEAHYVHFNNDLYSNVVTSGTFTTESAGTLQIQIENIGEAPLITIPDGMENEAISLTVLHGDHGGTYAQDLDAVTLTGTAIAAQARCLSRVFTSVTPPNDIRVTNGFWLEATTNPGEITVVQKIDGVANGETDLLYQMVQADAGKTFTVDETLLPSTYTSAPYVMVHTPTAPLKPVPPIVNDGPDGASRYVHIVPTPIDNGGAAVEKWNISFKEVSVAVTPTPIYDFQSGDLVALPKATDYEFKQQAVNENGDGLWSDGTINSTPAENQPPVNTQPPDIPETGEVGTELTVTPGTWTGIPTPTPTYQWYRDDLAITGETGTSYTPDTAGTHRVDETATNSEGSATAASNDSTVTAGAAWEPNDLTNLIAWYDLTDPSTMYKADGTTNVANGDEVFFIENKATGALVGTHRLTGGVPTSNMYWYSSDGGYLHLDNSNAIRLRDESAEAGNWHGHSDIWMFFSNNHSSVTTSGVMVSFPNEGVYTNLGEATFVGQSSRGHYSGSITYAEFYMNNVLMLSSANESSTVASRKQQLRDMPEGWWITEYFNQGGGYDTPNTRSLNVPNIGSVATGWQFFQPYELPGTVLHYPCNVKDIIVSGPTTQTERDSLHTFTASRPAPNWVTNPTVLSVTWTASGDDTHALPPVDPSDPINLLTTVYFGSAGPDTMVADLASPPEYPYAMHVANVEIGQPPPPPGDFSVLFWDGAKYEGNFPGVQAALAGYRDQTTELHYYFSYDPEPEGNPFDRLTQNLHFDGTDYDGSDT